MENKDAIELLERLLSTADNYDYPNGTWELNNLVGRLRDELERHQVSSKFNIPVSEIHNCGNQWYSVYVQPEDHYLGFYGDGNTRSISWSDDGRQPKNEWLFVVSFPTGAYIFGEQYPTETFRAFFDELKTFNPKYSDTRNSALYFDAENAGEVYRNLKDIFLKHKAEVQKELDKKRIAKLKAELEKLESDSE